MVLSKFSAVAEHKARTPQSGVQFFPFTSAFNCATTGWRKAKKNGAVSLLLCLLKKLLYVFHSKHLFLSIEKAERLNARLILLFAVQIDFYAEIFDRKE